MREFWIEAESRQPFTHPAVYLDHWAIRKFSGTPALQDRLVSALHSKDGTLVLSPTNFFEFVGMTDTVQIAAAEAFLDRLLLRVYIGSDDLRKWEGPDTRGQPPCDSVTARALASKAARRGSAVSFTDYLALYPRNSSRLGPVLDSQRTRLADILSSIRDDPQKRNITKTNAVAGYPTATVAYVTELIRDSVLDVKGSIPANDIDDWRHALTGLRWCDFVLLDAKWEQRVATFQRRISAERIPVTLPRCYSAKQQGVERFLSALETWAPPVFK